MANQWRHIWPHTQGFAFDPASLRGWCSPDGRLALVDALWTSEGVDAEGNAYPRRGRASLALAPSPESPVGWVALHTHFSLSP